MADSFQTDVIRTAIAPELIQRGWNLYDYRTQEPMEDAVTWQCRWCGVATHPDKPNRVLGIRVSEWDVQRYSGKPVDYAGRFDAGDLAVLPFALEMRPMFQATPKGKSWHVEVNGKIIASGKFSRHLDRFRDEGVQEAVDALESVVLGRTTFDPQLAAKKALEIPARRARRMLEAWVQSACDIHKVTAGGSNYFGARFTLKAGYTIQHVNNLVKLNPAFNDTFAYLPKRGKAILHFQISK